MKKLLIIVISLLVILAIGAMPLMAADEDSPTDIPSSSPSTPVVSSGDALTPNVIVTQYGYGEGPVQAGHDFSLTFTLYNTSKSIPIHNVMVRIGGGESFALRNEADTFHISKINAKGSSSHTTGFSSSVLLKEGSYPVSISATFEYYDGGAKLQATSELNLAIPVVQGARIEITKAAVNSYEVYPYEEYGISYTFINTGFGQLLNTVISVVDRDSGDTLNSVYLGTVEPSSETSGSSNLLVSFEEPGTKNLQFVISYEDSKLNKQTTTYDFTAEVVEAEEMAGDEMMAEDVQTGLSPVIILLCVILIIIIAVTVIIVVVRKRRAKAREAELLEDDEDEDEDEGEDSEEDGDEHF